jgi:hypothetical protein
VVVEELAQGGDGGPSRLGPLAWVVIALICVGGGVLLLSGHGGGTSAATGSATPPAPTSSAAQPHPSLVQDAPDDPRLTVNIGAVCPASTDGRKRLRVSFELVNLGANDVTLLGVKPLLPLHGLQPVGTATSGGSCAQPGTGASGGLLPAGEKRLFTMHFRLPKSCPQPFPVQASVRLRVDQMVGTTTVPVFADLGSVEFDTCPSGST